MASVELPKHGLAPVGNFAAWGHSSNPAFGPVKRLRALGGHWRTGRHCSEHQSRPGKFLASQYVCQVDLSVSPDLIVGFRREEGSWVQVPVQVKSSFFTFGLFTSYHSQSFLR